MTKHLYLLHIILAVYIEPACNCHLFTFPIVAVQFDATSAIEKAININNLVSNKLCC